MLDGTICGCRFHLLKPEYVHHRIKELQRAFRLRIILCNVDLEDTVEPLAQITKAAILNDCTLFCAFNHEVAALAPLCQCAVMLYAYQLKTPDLVP